MGGVIERKDAMTMGEIVRRSSVRYGNRTAIIYRDRRYLFREYNAMTNVLANTLTKLGIKKGDHVAALGKNSVTYLALCHATAKIGVVFGTINWRLAASEIAFIVNDADNKVLFVEQQYVELIEQIRDDLKNVQIVVYGEDGDHGVSGFDRLADLSLDVSDEEPNVEVNGDDPAIIMYTSGTTGLPKGAMLTHRNVVTDTLFCLTYWPPAQDDCYLLSMPMNHVSGLHTGTTTFLMRGLPMVIMDQWDNEEACRLIEKYRITVVYALVTPLLQLLNSPLKTKYDIRSVAMLLTAAARYSPEIIMDLMGLFELERILFAYGLTEAGPVVTTTEYNSDLLLKPNTIGKPNWYNDVQLLDDNGNQVKTGDVGEIVVKGPNVFFGYYNRPDANEKTLVDGWLHTGDLAYEDADGFLFFVDRKKDMIKSGGENVYSIEVELALKSTNAELDEVAVVGVPDEKWGEMVTAFVTLKKNASVTQEEIIGSTEKVLARYKLPKKIIFKSDLPKNVSGKVLKRELRDEMTKMEGKAE